MAMGVYDTPGLQTPTAGGRRVEVWFTGIIVLVTMMLALHVWAGYGVLSSSRALVSGDALLRETDNLLHLLQEAEIAENKYVLTGKTTDLNEYHLVRGSAPAAFGQLDLLAREEMPHAEDTCQVVIASVSGALTAMDAVVAARTSQGMEVARALLTHDQKLRSTELARFEIIRAQMAITARIDQRIESAKSDFDLAALASFLAFGIGLPTGIAMLRRIRRAGAAERRLRLQVEAANLQLEARVAMRTAELLKANRALADANAVKDRFLANMSHELRTPLNAVIGFSEMISTEMLGPVGQPRYADYARDILASGRHLLALIEDILDLSRIQAGRIDIARADVEPRRLALEALSMVVPMARAAGVTASLVMRDAPDQAHLDARRVKQILINLLSNAIRYSDRNGTVRLILDRTESDGRSLRIEIVDDGSGMTDVELARAMQPFEQVSRDRERRSGGTGLGLPLTKLLVTAHGGSFDITSTPGVGTRVVVEL
ncbi:ATP-binding protein [Tistrella bauzanensis]|uniref:histidine kinase n=1 Tax=Tistrella arctica TaxID=3133430 RepID=A0ABU9YIE3_9PROT